MPAASDEEVASLSAAFREAQREIARLVKERDAAKDVRDKAQADLNAVQDELAAARTNAATIRASLRALLNQ